MNKPSIQAGNYFVHINLCCKSNKTMAYISPVVNKWLLGKKKRVAFAQKTFLFK